MKEDATMLKRVIRKPRGKPSYEDWDTAGYYSSVANALKGLIGFEVRETELEELRIVVEKIDGLHTLIDNLDLSQ